MRILQVDQGSEEWHRFRKGKITGTRVKEMWAARMFTKDKLQAKLTEFGIPFNKSDTVAKLNDLLPRTAYIQLLQEAPKLNGFYEVVAEQLALDEPFERPMERGLRLEDEAADLFAKEYGKELIKVGCCISDIDPRIINSPDRLIKSPNDDDIYREAVEIKCLASARHIQAIVEDKVPDEYTSQVVQYFVVNPYLDVLYFVFYDPRIVFCPMKVIEVTRESLGTKPEDYLEFQLAQLVDVDNLVEKLSF